MTFTVEQHQRTLGRTRRVKIIKRWFWSVLVLSCALYAAIVIWGRNFIALHTFPIVVEQIREGRLKPAADQTVSLEWPFSNEVERGRAYVISRDAGKLTVFFPTYLTEQRTIWDQGHVTIDWYAWGFVYSESGLKKSGSLGLVLPGGPTADYTAEQLQKSWYDIEPYYFSE